MHHLVMADAQLNVFIRLSDETKFSVDIDATATVLDLKKAAGAKCDPPCPPEQQKLVHKGKILKDGDTLESYG